jgi:hypothetical protein
VLDIASEAGHHREERRLVQLPDAAHRAGRENAKMFLKDNPALMADVEVKVKGVLGIAGGPEDAPRRRSRRGIASGRGGSRAAAPVLRYRWWFANGRTNAEA